MSNIVLSDFQIPVEYKEILCKYPVLTAQEEHEVAVRFHQHSSREDAEILVFSNFRGVLYITHQYKGYNLPFMDLVQEGLVGLMRAVKRYDPFKGVRLFTYAMPWIKAEIQKYITLNWKLVKITTSDTRRKLFFGLRKLTQHILPSSDNELAQLSRALNIDTSELSAVDAYMRNMDINIDTLDNIDSFDILRELSTPEQVLLTNEYERHVETDIREAISTLNTREQSVVHRRFFKTPADTLDTISKDLDISIERVRQIEKSALRKIGGLLPYFKN